MSDAVLIFTFSPVQSFIAEARRASDLYVGSQILVHLAEAVARAIEQQQGTLIYPAPPLEDDIPNKLVARVFWEEAEAVAEAAKKALLSEWTHIADTARNNLMSKNPLPDARWHDIWARQTSHLWEIYWGAASMENRPYKDAYDEASRAVDAVKQTRMFVAAEEPGVKDSLSGCREALHITTMGARDYWAAIGKQVGAAKLRPNGDERLDAIGTVKRFSKIADESHFPSTSTVASADFLTRARGQLAGYREVVEILLGSQLYCIGEDRDWPHDGDLLFLETLTAKRLESSYGVSAPDSDWLQEARKTLSAVYQATMRPSPYYAILVLDGDGIGQRINTCLSQSDPQQAHEQFSRQFAAFSAQVKEIVPSLNGSLIYNGGDDVLVLAPLRTAFGLAAQLATQFKQMTGGTASAGLAVVHHLYPLGAALQAARAAERQAKQVTGKNTVCVHVLKRSGEVVEMRSPWNAVGDTLAEIVRLFQGDVQGAPLSSKFAYDVLHAAYALPEANEKGQAELRRLLTRHRDPQHPQAPHPDEWAQRLKMWAADLPQQLEELGRWLVFARFVAQEGSD